MKLKSLKLANPIRVGTQHPSETFFHVDKGFDIEVMPGGNVIQVVDKTGMTTYSTIFNTIYFETVAPIATSKGSGRNAGAEAQGTSG